MNNLKALIAKYSTSGPRYTSYPTALYFTDKADKQALQKLAVSDLPASLYVHIPFCKSLCLFCGCSSSVCADLSKIDEYLTLVEKELDLWRQAGMPRRALRQIHFGGGTPNLMTPAQTLRAGRRFDFKLKNDRITFLSDYAHHPKEIYQSAKSIRELYQDKKITAIFQPHLYTRTRDFYQDFADALSQLDEVILTEIYPAREEPIEGVTSKLIYDNLKPGVEKQIIEKKNVLEFVKKHDFEVLIVLGAGDLDNQVPEITDILKEKYK